MHPFRIIPSTIFLFLLSGNIYSIEIGKDILKNGDFENQLSYWKLDYDINPKNQAMQLKPPIEWQKSAGKNYSGAIYLKAPYKAFKNYIYQVAAEQCIRIYNAGLFTVKANFRYEDLPINKYGHRIYVYWFESEDCSTGGQFGDFLDPELNEGWQEITKTSLLPALNAKAVLIQVFQNQKSSEREFTWYERIWKYLLNLFDKAYPPKTGFGYWDNIALIPTKLLEPPPSKNSIDNNYTLPLGQNYVKNGSFQSGLENWHFMSEKTWSEDGHQDDGAVRTKLISKDSGRGTHAFTQCINFVVSQLYEMGIWLKRDNSSTQNGGGRYRSTWYEKEDCQGRATTSHKHADPKPGNDWQELKVDNIIPPKGSRSVKVEAIQSILGPGEFSIYWDNAYFRPVKN